MKKLASTLATIILPMVAIAQTTDVDGWNGAKWGMTITQVTAVITHTLERDPQFASARAPVYRTTEPFKLLDSRVRAYFSFSRDENRLIGVVVQIESQSLESPHSSREPFERFRQSLVEKYGQPTFTDDRGRIVVWRLASSSITLQQAEVGGKPFVGVTYKQASK